MKKEISFILNDSIISAEVDPALPLLDFIRKEKHLHGAKLVCKEGDCGACSVIIGEITDSEVCYKTVTSCIYPIGNVDGCHIVTIEGLNGTELLPQQKVFVDEGASQCGFCTPGFIISLTCYLLNNDIYNYTDAVNSIGGNICRCTGYESIKRAVRKLLDDLADKSTSNISLLIANNYIPEFFEGIYEKLGEIRTTVPKNGQYFDIPVAGGSDLFVQKPDDLLGKNVLFVNAGALDYIEEDGQLIRLGAAVTFEKFKNSEIIKDYFPGLAKQLNLVASLPIRNMATIGGNLVNASPIGDYSIILLALQAKLIIKADKLREVSISDFYLGYKQLDLQPGEIIEEIYFEKPKGDFYFNFEKVSKRTHLDIASVNSACSLVLDGDKIISCHISAGGVAPVPKYLKRTSESLTEKELTPQIILDALKIVREEISPISDVRGGEEYKRLLLNQLIKAHFLEVMPELIMSEELI